MATFLKLCQDVARESGTVSGTQPTSVLGQSGRLAKIVSWTAEAWRQIQTARNAWAFHRAEFDVVAIPGNAEYTGASWNIADLARWIPGVTVQDPDLGRGDESFLRPVSWETYRLIHAVGSAAEEQGRPRAFTIRPGTNALVLTPRPDKAYVVRGEYWRTPQVLAANADVPLCPERFHDAIKWKALVLLHSHDEGINNIALARQQLGDVMQELERDQLPAMGVAGGPLA